MKGIALSMTAMNDVTISSTPFFPLSSECQSVLRNMTAAATMSRCLFFLLSWFCPIISMYLFHHFYSDLHVVIFYYFVRSCLFMIIRMLFILLYRDNGLQIHVINVLFYLYIFMYLYIHINLH